MSPSPVAHAQLLPTRLPAQPADRRADGHARSVSLSREMVRIDRTVAGVAMRVAVPVRAYRGVALTLDADASGALAYRLHLVHADRDLSIALEEAPDDRDIVADWRLWSRFFRLPALVERRSGAMEQADPALGDLLLGTGAPDRRVKGDGKRRSRFLRRRKVGCAAGPATVHGDEREIIART